MNKIRKIYIPSIAMNFMYCIVFSSIINIISGNNLHGYYSFPLQLLGFLIVCMVVDHLLGKINFKSYLTYCLTSLPVNYTLFLVTGFVFHWFGFRPANLIQVTIVFLLICSLVYYHFYRLHQEEARAINEMLERKNR